MNNTWNNIEERMMNTSEMETIYKQNIKKKKLNDRQNTNNV